MKIRLLFIGILLNMTQGVWAQGSGDGSSELTPIVISSIADLNQLSLNVRAVDSDGYQGKYIELKNDLDFSEVALFDTDGGEPDSNFWPIGYSDGDNNNSPFRGIFNGGGHTIKGITVNRPDVDYHRPPSRAGSLQDPFRSQRRRPWSSPAAPLESRASRSSR